MTADDILWFKLQFGAQITAAAAGTPFDLDRLTAIACQETGYIWRVLRKRGLSTPQILALCVGDTLDADAGRSAFPKTKADLLSAERGDEMFTIARAALVEMAAYVPGYAGVAKKPHKFCHGFGLFQYDLQFFKDNPDHFLERRYARLEDCLALCLAELQRGLKKLKFTGRPISDLEMAYVAIAYNTGGFDPARGLKQGHKSDDGRYYGQAYYDYLLLSRSVQTPGTHPRGLAITPPPSAVAARGEAYVVDTREGLLNVRATPLRDPADPNANLIGGLPDGHRVRAVDDAEQNGFLEIETSLVGALVRGYVAMRFLRKAASAPIMTAAPAASPPQIGIVPVYMPRKSGTLTRRIDPAGAHSLNEPGAPTRKGDTPAKLCAELDAIIDWLAVDDPAHARYQPREGKTFCNIYAHDYCHLAGAYLPRVWWTPGALVALGQGQAVTPRYGDTIEEVRANGLFRWLRDFGLSFGWRQTGTLDKLQQHANQGGIGLIVARRTQEGKPGHIVLVAPETQSEARRENGVVTLPLQSQAGAANRRRGAGTKTWWTDEQFAEFAYWIHA